MSGTGECACVGVCSARVEAKNQQQQLRVLLKRERALGSVIAKGEGASERDARRRYINKSMPNVFLFLLLF